ncbi:lysoplasmalogenase-like protein TMEM86A [Agrilus planipennis]|uniref:lysoplasmalogenase n=1 Tax=Agrilus planipennis TaxID=224129 RepID=A0A1W4WR36_AGRPL|nr:lysoplasmalogenase-like protein TMEM86A [Agrilus planipennis]
MYIMPDLHGIFIPGIIIYSYILTTMVWRAIARVQFFEDLWTWSKLCTCAGGISFAISDFLIGVDHFKYNIEYAQVLIMATYYAAQVGIALSVVDYTTRCDKLFKNKELLEIENKVK